MLEILLKKKRVIMIRLDLVHIECHEYVFMFFIFYTISRKGRGIHSSSQGTHHSGSSAIKRLYVIIH